jgi:tetratricopeptide (TPR) repeat protein
LRLAVAVNLASWATQFGDLRRSLEIVDEALADPPSNPKVGAEHLGYSPYIWLVMNRGRLLTYMGRCNEADEAFERALRLAREHDEPEIACWTHQGYVDLAYLRDDAVVAGAHAAQAVTLAERIGTLLALWSAYHTLGRALTMRGAGNDAIEALDNALRMMRENRTGLHLVPLVLASLAEAHLAADDPARAEEIASEALEAGDGAIAVRARVLLARARRSRDGADIKREGEELVGCLNVLERTGYRSLEPMLRTELAELAALLGDVDEERHQRLEVERIRSEMERVGAER